MKLIDEEPWQWMLYEENDNHYLDVLCSHSAVDYRFAIRLNDKEIADFREGGRAALSRLAHDIHYSAPGVIGNTSRFKERRVSEAIDKRIVEAK